MLYRTIAVLLLTGFCVCGCTKEKEVTPHRAAMDRFNSIRKGETKCTYAEFKEAVAECFPQGMELRKVNSLFYTAEKKTLENGEIEYSWTVQQDGTSWGVEVIIDGDPPVIKQAQTSILNTE